MTVCQSMFQAYLNVLYIMSICLSDSNTKVLLVLNTVNHSSIPLLPPTG